MRTIVVGDIHGCYNELKELIVELKTKKEYNKDTDRLIFIGDYIDRGRDSDKVIKYIRELQRDNDKVIALKGNHEDMCVNYYKYREDNWKYNGGNATIKSFHGHKQLMQNLTWMENLPLYYEDDYFVYVHAGIDVDKPLDKQSNYDLLWVRESFIYNPKKFNKRVVFGHTPTQSLTGKDKPCFTYTDNIAIDTGCVYGGKLTALIIEDDKVKKFFQVSNGNQNDIKIM